jgi:ribonuclease HII
MAGSGLPSPSLERERHAWAERRAVVGVDEAGRGPLAGPVVAAAVAFAADARRIRGVRDSKLLSAGRREVLAALIRRRAARLGVGAASCREIDRLNIRGATALAMRRAIARALGSGTGGLARPRSGDADRWVLLVDGLPFPELRLAHEALVDGDARCYSVAAAGIIAKTVRDRLMRRLADRYPAYGWATNMGYATEEHLAALLAAGASPHHRLTFAPLGQTDLFFEVGGER